MSERLPRDAERNAIRSKRLMHDLSGLGRDEGVMAKPLDSALYHWQVNIFVFAQLLSKCIV